MQVQVNGQHITITEAIRAHAEGNVESELGHFADRIGNVIVHVSDINGPKGGKDMRCAVEVHVNGGGNAFAEEVDGDLYAAITRAMEKVGRAVSKTFDKKREHAGA